MTTTIVTTTITPEQILIRDAFIQERHEILIRREEIDEALRLIELHSIGRHQLKSKLMCPICQ